MNEPIKIKFIRERIVREHFDSLPDINNLKNNEREFWINSVLGATEKSLFEGFVSFKFNGRNYIYVNHIDLKYQDMQARNNYFYDFDNDMMLCENPFM